MTRKELQIGVKVYHVLLYNWGQGEVIRYRDRDALGYKNVKKYLVRWSGEVGSLWMRAGELRKTPKGQR